MDYLVNVATEHDKKIEVGSNFYISITPELYQELVAYTAHYKKEVSGCGMVDVIKHEDTIEYAITEVFLPGEQSNSGAYTEVDETMMHSMMHDFATRGIDTSKLRMHWHSHNTMGVFHSGTDIDNYATLLKQDYYVSLVLNHDKDLLGRIDLAIPFNISVSGIPVYVKLPLDTADTVQEKIDANLKALDDYIEAEDKKTTDDWRSRCNFLDYDKRKRHKKGTVTVEHLEDQINAVLGLLNDYTPYEQDQYGECEGGSHGKHTCFNPTECKIYNDLDKELEALEVNAYD